MRHTIITLPSIAAILTATASHAQLTVPSGYVADQLVGRIDNATPRLLAITNSAYGNGVITASTANGITTIRRLGPDGMSVLAVIPGFPAGAHPLGLAFDKSGLFGGELHLTMRDGDPTTDAPTKLYRIASTGSVTHLWTSPIATAFSLDFTDGLGGYTPGGYLEDGNGNGGTALWRMTSGPTFTQLSPNSVPAGRTDLDVAGLQFDRTGAYGGLFYMADSDANNDNRTVIYALTPSLSWQTLSTPVTTQQRFYGDLTITPGTGSLGAAMFVTDRVSSTVMTVSTSGVHAVWASGFTGISSVSAAPDGSSMYVSDFNGVYRIRPTTNAPGPTLVAHTPSLPPGVPFSNPGGISSLRLIWSGAVEFAPGEITVTDAGSNAVPFTASGSGSQFTLLSFGTPLADAAYTITVLDNARAPGGAFIDGDGDGVAGGHATLTLTHRTCDPSCGSADFNGDGDVGTDADIEAFFRVLAGGPC